MLQINGETILSDDFKRTSPWSADPVVTTAAEEAARRLHVAWQVDRKLADAPILVPYEPHNQALNPFFDDMSLLPDESSKPLTSIREVCLEGEGWISFDQLKERASSHWYDLSSRPKVASLLVVYQASRTGFGASTSVTPAEFAILRQRYQAEQERKATESLDSVKQLARQRAVEKNSIRIACNVGPGIRGEGCVR